MSDISYFLIALLFISLIAIGWLIWKLASATSAVRSAKQINDRLEFGLEKLEGEKSDLASENSKLKQLLTQANTVNENLKSKLETEGERLQKEQKQFEEKFALAFQNILEERSERLAKLEKEQLQNVLRPFDEHLKQFKEQVEKAHKDETEKLTRLDQELKNLTLLNRQLDEDARGLTNALKGDNKAQGNWGEWQLEKVLLKSGLEKGIHFETQSSFNDEDGRKQPDFLVHLPEEKHLIIDAKVSLKAYEKFCSAETAEEEKTFLNKHIESLKTHIKSLGNKNYQQLEQLKSPDYILLFVPIEPAFSAAFRNDDSLYQLALDNNVVVVTTSTLMATMRTVSFIWTQENQRKNVLEIAKQGGLMYDRLASLLEELQKMGNQINALQNSHETVLKKVGDGKGNLLSRAEKMKKLGAQASKRLP
ncbi:DNA recombination protein RmuC [Halocola ammonii]